MTEGRHIGSKQWYEVVTLPKSWRPTDGMKYPLTILKTGGKKLTFYSYQEHHEYIRQLFRPN